MKVRGLLAAFALIPLMIVFALAANFVGVSQSQEHHPQKSDAAGQQKSDVKLPPFYENPDDVKELPVVLDPNQFKDANTRKAYQIAKDNPRLLLQLPCGCSCYISDGHKSLLSCYADKHGEYCGTCQQEALEAAEMAAKKMSIKEIRAKIIEKFIY
jgi:hypothetical protein